MNRLLKKAIAAITAAAVAATLTVTVSAAEFESAESAVANINVGWNLGNTFDCKGDWISGGVSSYETAWGNPVVSRELIAGVKEAGFNAIRLPVTWDAHTDDKGNIDKPWLDRVQEVVDWILAEDLYCVLNVHHDGGSDGWLVGSEVCLEKDGGRFEGLWRSIAERFRDYGEKLIFESFNEVLDSSDSWTESHTPDGFDSVNRLNRIFVDTVRSTGGNNASRNLMLQTYSAGTAAVTFENFKLPWDKAKNHLILQVHSYDPQGFTWTDATWTTMTDKWGSEAQINQIERLFRVLDKYSDSIGVPVVVGEFGAQDKSNEAERAEYAAFFIAEGAEYGIKCFWWDNGYDYRIIDRSTGKPTAPLVVEALVDNAQGGTAEPLRGDADGDGSVTAIDAAAILRSCVGLGSVPTSADYDSDGTVTALDAAAILSAIVGL